MLYLKCYILIQIWRAPFLDFIVNIDNNYWYLLTDSNQPREFVFSNLLILKFKMAVPKWRLFPW